MTPQEVQAALETAVARLNGGRAHDARTLLERTVEASPGTADAHRLLGLARKTLRDLPGAEQALRKAASLDKANLDTLSALAEVELTQGRAADAEKTWRSALTVNRRHAPTVRGLAHLLNEQARAAEALQVTTPAFPTTTDTGVAAEHGAALKVLKRYDEALAAYLRAAELQPDHPISHHNVAAAYADLGRYAEAESEAQRAIDLGLRGPETQVVLGHALQGQDRLDGAEAAYRAAIRARPNYADSHRDLAQLIWMRTEDLAAATEELDRAIAASPSGQLLAVRAQVYAHAARDAEAYDMLAEAARRRPDDGQLHLAASQQAAKAGRPMDALTHADRAALLLESDFKIEATRCEALLANGMAEAAAMSAEMLRRREPDNQRALALQATAWRLLGDERYGALYDYAAFVRPYQIDTPEGWGDLDSYLADLREGLATLHVTRTHPVGQSLRHGSQTNQSLLRSENPAVKAFPSAIDGPIRAHIAALGPGRDPVRSRVKRDYAIAGIWSVRLRPGGFHIDHVHPEGWLSSATYIALPKAVEGEGRRGWIRFGEPGIATRPALEAEHFVKPELGMLVLFPSYMWHGTVPFEGDDQRLTVAFDLVPK